MHCQGKGMPSCLYDETWNFVIKLNYDKQEGHLHRIELL